MKDDTKQYKNGDTKQNMHCLVLTGIANEEFRKTTPTKRSNPKPCGPMRTHPTTFCNITMPISRSLCIRRISARAQQRAYRN